MTGPAVETDLGFVRGTVREGISPFRGIPFASAPEGPLRFRLPVPPAAWEGVRDAVAFGSAPPQPAPAPGVPPFWRPADGLDCLTLNVWSPDPGTAGVPDHRGLHDQLGAAVGAAQHRGVRRRPGRGHPVRPVRRGSLGRAADRHAGQFRPFRRAIAQSVPDGYRTAAEAARITRVLAEAAGVPPTWAGFAGLPPEAVVAVQDAPLTDPQAGFSAFGPVIGGDLVTGPPWTALRAGDRRHVDLICGFTHAELRGMAPLPPGNGVDLAGMAAALGLGPDAGAAYRAGRPGRPDAEVLTEMMSDALVRMPTTWVAEAHAQAGGRTWLYDLTWPAPAAGAGHGVDVPLIFGNPGTRYAARLLGTPPLRGFGDLSREMRRAWVSFAATGDPGWPRFDAAGRRTRLWDTPPADTAYPLGDLYRLWPH